MFEIKLGQFIEASDLKLIVGATVHLIELPQYPQRSVYSASVLAGYPFTQTHHLAQLFNLQLNVTIVITMYIFIYNKIQSTICGVNYLLACKHLTEQ